MREREREKEHVKAFTALSNTVLFHYDNIFMRVISEREEKLLKHKLLQKGKRGIRELQVTIQRIFNKIKKNTCASSLTRKF